MRFHPAVIYSTISGRLDHRSCIDAQVLRRRVAALEAAGCDVCVEISTAHGHVKDFVAFLKCT